MRPIQLHHRRRDAPIKPFLIDGRRGAFTLAELAIVLLIMSVFTAVAAPAFLDSLLFHRVESAARRVKTDLELARHSARLKSASRSVAFTGSSYTLPGIKSLDDPTAVYTVDLAASPFELDSLVADFNNTTMVSFDGYGTPSSGGTVILTAKAHQATVTLNTTTGEVTITTNHPNGGAAQVDAP